MSRAMSSSSRKLSDRDSEEQSEHGPGGAVADQIPAHAGAFQVLAFSVPDDRQQLVETLQTELNIVHADASVMARTLPGLVGRSLSQSVAVRLAEALRNLGVSATIIDETDIPDLSHPRQTHHLKCTSGGLVLVDTNGVEEEPVPWSRVSVISVGNLPADDPAHYHAAPLASMSTRSRLTGAATESESADMSTAAVVLTDPDMMICFEHREMNYEYLAARKTTSSLSNFAAVVRDLMHFAPDAWVTPATHTFIDRGLTRHYQFRSPEEFTRYTAFQYLLSRHLRSQLSHSHDKPAKVDS